MAKARGGKKLYLWGAIGLVIAAAIVAYVTHGRASAVATERDELRSETARGPQVQATIAKMSSASRDIRLLADARPYSTVTLFAKVSGYLKSVNVDKGDLVKAGQVLAEIDSAETDAQYARRRSPISRTRRSSHERDARPAAARQRLDPAGADLGNGACAWPTRRCEISRP